MSLLFSNNAISTLAAGINTSTTSLTVQAGDGNLFPSPSGNDSFLVTLQDAANNIEIVECTSRSGDALTIVRAQEGTLASNWLAGDAVELRVTAGVLAGYRQEVGAEVNPTAINRTLGLADRHQFIECNDGTSIVSLPDAATVGIGWQVTLKNNKFSGQTAITINKTTVPDTINGQLITSFNLGFGQSVQVSTNENADGFITVFDTGNSPWPVGSIYMNVLPTNPGDLFGGIWTRIAQGRTLIGEGSGAGLTNRSAGAEGGVEDAVLPSHSHSGTALTAGNHNHTVDMNLNPQSFGSQPCAGVNNPAGVQFITSSTAGAHTHNLSINSSGVNANDGNMMPYLVTYIWQRTA